MVSRKTRQKELILKVVRESSYHPTAQEIYDKVAETLPQVSLTTIYRNLNNLVERGLVRTLILPDQPARFDGVLSKHYHLLCKVCGKIEDAKGISYNHQYDKKIDKDSGFFVLDHVTTFNGLCSECTKAKTKD